MILIGAGINRITSGFVVIIINSKKGSELSMK